MEERDFLEKVSYVGIYTRLLEREYYTCEPHVLVIKGTQDKIPALSYHLSVSLRLRDSLHQ